jgi:hypothetical protein
MKFKLLCATIVGLGLGMAIAATIPAFQLRGDRFKPLTYEQMTPAQKTMTDHVLAGDRGSMNGPYNAAQPGNRRPGAEVWRLHALSLIGPA